MLPQSLATAFGAVATVWVLAFTPTETRHYNVVISGAFPVQDVINIGEALQEWRDAVPTLRLDASVGQECNPDLPRAPSAPRTVCVALAGPDDLPENIAGMTTRGAFGAVVYLPAGAEVDTAAHEFGHAMGLDHDTHRGTLMYPAKYCVDVGIRMPCGAEAPTPRDVAAWHRIPR